MKRERVRWRDAAYIAPTTTTVCLPSDSPRETLTQTAPLRKLADNMDQPPGGGGMISLSFTASLQPHPLLSSAACPPVGRLPGMQRSCNPHQGVRVGVPLFICLHSARMSSKMLLTCSRGAATPQALRSTHAHHANPLSSVSIAAPQSRVQSRVFKHQTSPACRRCA